jgi:2-isopropylmalate synthase
VAYVLNRDHGLDLPRWLQVDFSASVQALAEQSEAEVQSDDIYDLFLSTYKLDEPALTVGKYQLSRDDSVDKLNVQIEGLKGSPTLSGNGAGVVGAFTDAISQHTGHKIIVVEYSEHTLGSDGDAEAICYVQLAIDSTRVCGVGRSTDIVQATMSAILSGLHRYAGAWMRAA